MATAKKSRSGTIVYVAVYLNNFQIDAARLAAVTAGTA
jgi:hypothetical protein